MKTDLGAEEAVKNYYENYDEDKRLTSNHGKVEFYTSIKYIEKYLKPGKKILDIGASTGRYSHYFAQNGYEVDALELVQHNIDIFNQNTQLGEKVTIRQGNALELSAYPDNTYDITLLFGPMYHLFCTEDKEKALSEALRVTKKGRVLFVAYCMSDPSLIGFGFGKGNTRALITAGLLNPDTFESSSTPAQLFTLYRREEIDRLAARLSVKRLHFVGTDMYTNHFREMIDGMDEETFNLYLKYHFTICERADMTGMSHHTLDVLRKE